jgi:hypothetical protein
MQYKACWVVIHIQKWIDISELAARTQRFCILRYQKFAANLDQSGQIPVVALVFFDDCYDLRILVSPVIREIVTEEDLAFIESLLQDFLIRAKERPEDLFHQVLSINHGPLVPLEEESRLLNHPQLLAIIHSFVPYE